ncbi:unnamed protein product [Porites evermanni]|uniref:Coiled-coil domain-containing protein 102A n=1 Tax=Porites evermanni TaxID=104178 RepID=A0ABN8QF97_9CNID|nr:unnamed protein product [Porites evermanni]
MNINGAGVQVQAVNPTRHEKAKSAGDLPIPFTETDDLDARDELRERELEEARARASQMEKTMRWWSDCTANWREKWGKVRAERNKAREENRQLKLKLEAAAKEISNLKRERLAAQETQTKLEKEVEKLERELKKDRRLIPSARVEPSLKEESSDFVDRSEQTKNSSVYEATVPKLGAEKQFIEQILQKNELYESKVDDTGFDRERSFSVPAEERKRSRQSARKQKSYDENLNVESSQQFTVMRMKLEQTEKLLTAERSTKQNLLSELDGIQSDFTALKLKNEELKVSYQDASQEVARLRSKHEQQFKVDQEDAYQSGNNSENVRKITELRGEIERLQLENTEEWGRREKLESDKLALEREIKKLRLQIEDLSAQLSDSSRTSKGSVDIKQLQTQLDEKTREQQELKFAYNKVRKQLQEKAEELAHSKKRLDQHENEVRKLRTRVEELKVDLTKAEDELDAQTNNLRKLQRNLDEQTERAEGYRVEVEHLNSRLRAGGGAAPSLNTRYKPGRKTPMHLSSDSEEDSSFT